MHPSLAQGSQLLKARTPYSLKHEDSEPRLPGASYDLHSHPRRVPGSLAAGPLPPQFCNPTRPFGLHLRGVRNSEGHRGRLPPGRSWRRPTSRPRRPTWAPGPTRPGAPPPPHRPHSYRYLPGLVADRLQLLGLRRLHTAQKPNSHTTTPRTPPHKSRTHTQKRIQMLKNAWFWLDKTHGFGSTKSISHF